MKRILPVVLLLSSALFAQTAAQQPQDNEPEFSRKAHSLLREGKLDQALELYKGELKVSPDSQEANIGAGVVLDLMLRGSEARTYFEKAIADAKDEETRNAANRAMAMSWAFDNNCQMTVLYEQKVLDAAKAKNDFFRAGEIANEEAR